MPEPEVATDAGDEAGDDYEPMPGTLTSPRKHFKKELEALMTPEQKRAIKQFFKANPAPDYNREKRRTKFDNLDEE